MTVVLIIATISTAATGAFALITAALGAGLGFGAQNIVKDVLNGLAMVGEDQLGVGDVVDSGFATGVVEAVGIRTTQIRDVNGTLWYVRNGEILRVGNLSQGWARVIIESIAAEAIVIRLVAKTRSGVKDDVARELRARLKSALDGMGVKLPALNSIVLSGYEGAASVRGARPPKTAPINRQGPVQK
jgi:small-conductance mechanosensitive channel